MKLLIVECAGLGYNLWKVCRDASFWQKFNISAGIQTVFPALTCPVQASFRTALLPLEHGITANGFYDRKLHKTFFWEQSADLYAGARIWNNLRAAGGKVGEICWQQSLGDNVDLILSPAPIHKHHGGMIQDVYSFFKEDSGKEVTGELYGRICKEIGKNFNLFSYWGPFTSIKSSRWITDATIYCMKNYLRTTNCMLLTYLPHLDYALQRYGPSGEKIRADFRLFEAELEKLTDYAIKNKWEVLLFGDYAINNVSVPLFPNRILAKHGMLALRNIKGALYIDLHQTSAFAVTDHQIAYIYVKNRTPDNLQKIAELFNKEEHIDKVVILPTETEYKSGMRTEPELHSGVAGDIVLISKPDAWFAYPWWTNIKQAPDYAFHVDIHNKPGFDPCELFFNLWPPFSISQNALAVKGSHGRNTGEENLVFAGATFNDIKHTNSLIQIAETVKRIC